MEFVLGFRLFKSAKQRYKTEAEQQGWSRVFFSHYPIKTAQVLQDIKLPDEPWWLAVKNASWRKVLTPPLFSPLLRSPLYHYVTRSLPSFPSENDISVSCIIDISPLIRGRFRIFLFIYAYTVHVKMRTKTYVTPLLNIFVPERADSET